MRTEKTLAEITKGLTPTEKRFAICAQFVRRCPCSKCLYCNECAKMPTPISPLGNKMSDLIINLIPSLNIEIAAYASPKIKVVVRLVSEAWANEGYILKLKLLCGIAGNGYRVLGSVLINGEETEDYIRKRVLGIACESAERLGL